MGREMRALIGAYIMVQTHVGTGTDVSKRAATIDGVTFAENVTGPYDVIVKAEAPDIRELGVRVLRPLQGIDGVVRTMTCPIINR